MAERTGSHTRTIPVFEPARTCCRSSHQQVDMTDMSCSGRLQAHQEVASNVPARIICSVSRGCAGSGGFRLKGSPDMASRGLSCMPYIDHVTANTIFQSWFQGPSILRVEQKACWIWAQAVTLTETADRLAQEDFAAMAARICAVAVVCCLLLQGVLGGKRTQCAA